MQCSICHDDITTETGKTQLSCEHTFHFRCIAQWMIEHSTCPCCRNEVSEYENLSNIYIYDENTNETQNEISTPEINITIFQNPPQLDRFHIDLITNLIEAANEIEEQNQTVLNTYS